MPQVAPELDEYPAPDETQIELAELVADRPVVLKPIDLLIPYARNSRTHSDAHVAQIAASIREWGWTNPVLVDEGNGIIAGHGRVLAARKLGITDVPCIELGHLTDTQRRAYIIADNKLAMNAGWDDEMLKVELEDLKDAVDMGLIGFSADEVNVIFNGWQSDIDVQEKHGDNLDGIDAKLVVVVGADDKEMAKEAITNALDSAGVTYELR